MGPLKRIESIPEIASRIANGCVSVHAAIEELVHDYAHAKCELRALKYEMATKDDQLGRLSRRVDNLSQRVDNLSRRI